MKIEKKELSKNQLELKIEVSLEEIKPHLEKTASRLSSKTSIPGFRPGKAPFDLIKAKLGEMTIWQEALNEILSQTFYQAVTKEKLETVGQPDIKVEKLAPGNPIVYTATVSLLPEVVLGDWQKAEVKKNEVKIEKKDLEQTYKHLQEMQVKEAVVDRVANNGDKVELDFEVSIDKVVIEGGKSSKYPIVLGEGKMIPGFEEKIVGSKANDELTFDLKFPDKYFQTNLAGKLATFKVKVLTVFERTLPELNDEFAKNIGFENLKALEKQITENIEKEKSAKEQQRLERAAIEAVVKASTVEDLPEGLIHAEIHKMIHELQHSVQQQGMDFVGYLKSINKTHADLEKEFKPQAEERIKASLVLRKLAETEKIETTEEEIDTEVKKQELSYQDNPQALKDIKTPNYRQYLNNFLTNQKIVKFITDKIVK
ncbi:trigger factor [Candidatus Nomurabacteria bacterium]|nr:trigger factor [Candidatus Nomurabacteria bacterium]